MALRYSDVSAIFGVKNTLCSEIAHRIVLAKISSGEIHVPLEGTYHLIRVNVGSPYPKFFRFTSSDFVGIDEEYTGDIIDGIYDIDIDFEPKW